MEALFIIAIVLLIIMLIGHGLWVLVAWMFRGFQPKNRKRICARCGAEIASYPCVRCGHGAPVIDRHAVARDVLRELELNALIDRETVERVQQALAKAGRPPVVPAGRPVAVPAERPVAEPVMRATPPAAAEPPEVQLARLQPAVARPAPMHLPPSVRPTVPPAPPVAPPRPPRKPALPFSEVFKSFMEERNIRWGELVGGMIIVGCSLALVLSLWAQISERPYLKVTVFTSIVAGLFGLGLYADRKWRLPTTSYSILLIAMLMVPLHFAAMVAVGGQQGGLVLAAEGLGVLILGSLAYLAAGVVTPRARVLVSASLVALSLVGPAMYLAGLIQQHEPRGVVIRIAIMVGLLLIGEMAMILRMRRISDDTPAFGRELLSALGVLGFAALPSIAMHIAHGAGVPLYRQLISPVLLLAGLPLLEASSLLRKRFPKKGDAWNTTGWAMSLVAAGGLLLLVGLCWPMPVSIAIAAGLAAVLLGAMSLRGRDPVTSAVTPVAIAMGYVAMLAPVLGRVAWTDTSGRLLELAFTEHLALELLPLAAILLAVAAAFWKRSRSGAYASAGLAATAIVIGFAHLLLTVYARGVDLVEARWVFGAMAAGALAAGIITGSKWIVGIGSALAILAIERWFPGSWAWSAAAVGVAWSAVQVMPGRWRDLASANAWGGLLLAAGLIALGLNGRSLQMSAGLAWLLSAGAVLLLVGRAAIAELSFAQLAIAFACALQAIAIANRTIPLNDPRMWVIASATIVILQALWAAIGAKTAGQFSELVRWPVLPSRITGALASAAIVMFMGAWLIDSAISELLTTYSAGVPSRLAPLWFVPIIVMCVALLEQVVIGRYWWILALVSLYLAACGATAQLIPDYAATAIRFSCVVVMAVLSAAVLVRDRLGRLKGSLASVERTWAIVACGAIPLVLLTTMAAMSNLQQAGPRAPLAGSFLASIGAIGSYIVPLAIASIVFAAHAISRRSQAFALIAVGLVHFAVTLAFVLEYGVNSDADVRLLIRVNALAAGICAWIWIGVRQFITKDAGDLPSGLNIVSGACCLAVVVMAALIEPIVAMRLTRSVAMQSPAALAVSWAGLGLAASLIYRLSPQRRWPAGMFWLLLAGTGISGETALVTGGYYVAVRTLLVGHTLSTAIIYFAGRWLADRGAMLAGSEAAILDRPEPQVDSAGRVQLGYVTQTSEESAGIAGVAAARMLQQVRVWGILAAIAAFLLATFDMAIDPQRPWWTVGSLVTLASLALIIAQRELRPSYLYYTSITTCFAASFLWGSHFWVFTGHSVRDLVMLNLMVLSGMGLISLILERQVFAPAGAAVIRRLVPLHVSLNIICPLILLLVAVAQLLSPQFYAEQQLLLGLGGCAAVLALCVGRLWDPRRAGEIAILYVATLASILMLVALGEMTSPALLHRALISVVGLSIAWGFVFHRFADVGRWLVRMGAQPPLLWEMPQANAWLGLASTVAIIAHEGYQQSTRGAVSMSAWLIVVVAILLLIAAASMIAAALSRISDPLRLPFARRESYVVAAEALLLLLFLHIRLTCPWLFSGFFQQFWPAILMLLAFALAGMGEWLARRKLGVLAVPITQTAFVLPIVPAIAYAAAQSQVPYAAVLASATVYYGLWSALRRSTPAMLMAMGCFCGMIWALLWEHPSLRLDQHPQLWLIPPAVCMIAAAQLLRRQLSTQQTAVLRYTGLLLAYASSTGDILFIGVAKAPWLAGVLALISVCGVFLGILLKVRAFLYMGTGFLAISLVTLIYHAAANLHQTWLMWLAGIGLGVGILLAFAMFERHKEKLLGVVEDLKQWES